MKIKSDFILREVARAYVVVAVGKRSVEFNGMINLNESGAFLWHHLEKGSSENELVASLLEEYDVDDNQAKKDVVSFINLLKDNNLLEE